MRIWGTNVGCVFILAAILFSTSFASDKGLIVGRVMDKKTGEGLPGVNVQIENTVLGASTNLHGAFMIRRVPYGVYTVKISMIGYQKRRVNNVNVSRDDTAFVIVRLEETPIEIDPVVVTASKWQEEAANTPATVEVMTSKEILQRNPVKIEDALETAAGVQIIQESVNIRGSDGYTRGIGSRVLVMLDDVPVMNSDFGAVNWFMISPADVARAEVVRGAGSALHGSSAMGGVVNFITRDPQPDSRTYVRALLGVYDKPYEDEWDLNKFQNFHRQDFTHSRKIGNLGMRISGGRSQSTGFTEQGEFERYNLSGKFIYRFPNASKLTLFGNYMHDDSDVFIRWKNQKEATKVPPAELDKHQTQTGLTLFTKYSLPISSKAAIEARAYFNRFLLGTQVTSAGTFAPALGLGGSIQGNLIPFPSVSIVYGSDFKFDKVESDTSLYGNRDAILAAPYFQLDWQTLRNLNLTFGGRYDRYEIYSDPQARFKEGRVYDHFSPKFGINYKPFEGSTFRASVSNGFKFPVVAQLFLEFDAAGFTFRASPDLRSEESWTYEFGWRQTITPTWFFEINGFYTEVDDLIEVLIFPNLEAQFANIEQTQLPGIEFVTNGRWWDNRLGLKANFLYMDPRDEVQDQLLPYRQKFIAFVAPSLRLGSLEFQLDFKYASAQEVYLLSSFPQLVPQKVLDGRIFYYFGNHSFFVGVNNIGNYSYTLRDESLEEIRNFVAGFTMEF
ncbi:TonB-dependent receptor [candidate division KSB1 bacterium]|nr:TonB-dependent receptor [candidate division KSB1 bacterium]NIR73333.1 TonB-dependent receptor [candidate division KSB1 bacterium]NIS27039.1 TonB-dependent receptor [candidate division KSB1 bacterium]NIT73879.1 TonB-dependent receptor [candidate division KSB1 bacterium]NIU27784.1 TonB-dependent receptor [candidate division KSB1 bacterium]